MAIGSAPTPGLTANVGHPGSGGKVVFHTFHEVSPRLAPASTAFSRRGEPAARRPLTGRASERILGSAPTTPRPGPHPPKRPGTPKGVPQRDPPPPPRNPRPSLPSPPTRAPGPARPGVPRDGVPRAPRPPPGAARRPAPGPGPSPAARLRVEAAAGRLGYVRRRPGSPGRVSSGTIAAVVCEDACRVLGDPYFARLLWGVRRELAGRAPLVVLMAGRADEWRAAAGYLPGGQAEGVLLLGARRHHVAPLVQAAAGAPAVRAGRPLVAVAVPCDEVDDLGGAQAAARRLLASGRRRIGTIAGPADMGAAVDRLAGYRLAAREAGMGVNGLVCQGDLGRLSGVRAMRALLERRPDVDAVLAASDPLPVDRKGVGEG